MNRSEVLMVVLLAPIVGLAQMATRAAVAPEHVQASLAPGWTQLADLPPGVDMKKVKAGGCLACADVDGLGYVFGLRGNNTLEFFRYDPRAGAWTRRQDVPAVGSSGRVKRVKKGACISEVGGRLYAAKGGNTLEFFRYDPVTDAWAQLADIPPGGNRIRYGAGLAGLRIGEGKSGIEYVYLLKGSNTLEFFRYRVDSGVWEQMVYAPVGAGTMYKDGSGMVWDGSRTVYVLKQRDNELHALDVVTGVWTAKASLPLQNSAGQSKKVKAGGCVGYADGCVYALKGGGSPREFWCYDPATNAWAQQADMPLGFGGKGVKDGAALAGADGVLWAFKGNKTNEFYQYVPVVLGDGGAESGGGQAAGACQRGLRAAIGVTPSPARGACAIACSLPVAGRASLALYDASGRLSARLLDGYLPAGGHVVPFDTKRLVRGVYVVRLETGASVVTGKLVVE